MTRDDALRHLDRYEALSKDFGYANEASLREALLLVQQLRAGPLHGSYFREKLVELEEWAKVGFSTRKFEKYTGGASGVRSFALGALMTLRDLVEADWPV